MAPLVVEFLVSEAADRLLETIEVYRKNAPSVDDLAVQLGSDPEAAFRFVRDRIGTKPYSGTLRAPPAVRAASGGDTQDKAELLMRLLRSMGFDARIADAPVSGDIAARLLAATCAVPVVNGGVKTGHAAV